MSETKLVRQVLLHGSTRDQRLFRNNVGVLRDARGSYVRYGLCPGSSDVIGWTPHVVTDADVGRTVAIFTALECKVGRHEPTLQQSAFLAAVEAQGGIAALVRDVGDVDKAVARFRHHILRL